MLHLDILSYLPSYFTYFSKAPEVRKKVVPKEKVPVPVPKKMEALPPRGIPMFFPVAKSTFFS